MGKKGKKKGGGGKAKKKSGKREDEMTLKEAILAFQIQVKEKASEELQFEINGLKDKNKRFQQRNARLKDEQFIHIKTLLKQAKEQEKELEQKEVFNSEHVEQALKDKWEASGSQERVCDELRLQIAEKESEYATKSEEVSFWTDYQDRGAEEHKTQIKLLEGELEDMQQNFDDMNAHLQRQLDTAKQEVKAYMDECMAEQKFLASEKAMSKLDPASVQEVHENDWLKNEAEIHRAEEKYLLKKLEELEHENLEIISELLDCKQDDLKISRNFYLTEFSENDVLTDETMSCMDLKTMSIYDKDFKSQSSTSSTPDIKAIEERPQSAMQKYIEDKVFSIQEEEEEEEESEEENEYEKKEFLHLGALEIKLLCVHGTSKPIHTIDSRLQIVDGSVAGETVTRPVWPVQPPMMKAVVGNHPGSPVATKSG